MTDDIKPDPLKPDPLSLSPKSYIDTLRPRNEDGSGRFRQLRPEDGALRSPHADAQKRAYLAALEGGASVRQAVAAAGMRGTWEPSVWAEHDPEFAAAMRVVQRGKVPLLESRLDEISESRTDMPAVIATLARLKAEDAPRYARPEKLEVSGELAELTAAMRETAAILRRNEARLEAAETRETDG